MKNLIFVLSLLFMLNGCSAKEFNAGVDSVTNDISTAFNNAKDDGSKSTSQKDNNLSK
ncbi:hypothetical protein [Sulfurimonas sp.]|uniref:hypothetical protein n=1 Tax=Sulfurimonas sp. TaxID=2022749 RepID=UPI0025F9EC55|nr:hypothetical protein [Sulfurimonas sp.]MDD5156505.1 hypothetical protein [Sulfurimonas sp.]